MTSTGAFTTEVGITDVDPEAYVTVSCICLALWFPRISQKHTGRWIAYIQLSPGVNNYVNESLFFIFLFFPLFSPQSYMFHALDMP